VSESLADFALAALALPAEGGTLVAQVAVLTVLISIPLGTILARYAPELSMLFERGAAQRRAGPRSRSPDTVA
jgi:CPA2 family monovalent cation:H+ antiporter-2